MRHSPRLRRVFLIAQTTRIWTGATRRYMTEINAEPCDGCGLTRGRHKQGCEVVNDCTPSTR